MAAKNTNNNDNNVGFNIDSLKNICHVAKAMAEDSGNLAALRQEVCF